MSLSYYKDHYKKYNNLKDYENLSDKNNFCNLPGDIFSSIINLLKKHS